MLLIQCPLKQKHNPSNRPPYTSCGWAVLSKALLTSSKEAFVPETLNAFLFMLDFANHLVDYEILGQDLH